jgi:hypothetical protein
VITTSAVEDVYQLHTLVGKDYKFMATLSRKSLSPRAFSAQPSKSGLFVALPSWIEDCYNLQTSQLLDYLI